MSTPLAANIVAKVMLALEERGVDLSEFGEPTAREIAESIPELKMLVEQDTD